MRRITKERGKSKYLLPVACAWLASWTLLLSMSGCNSRHLSDLFPSSNSMLSGEADGQPVENREFVYWHSKFSSATTAAKQSNRPMLIAFVGSDWCKWCQKLDREVLDTPEFAAWCNDNVTLLKLDFPKKIPQVEAQARHNQKLRERYQSHIDGFPTIVVTDAAGKPKGSLGYVRGGPQAWIAKVESILDE